VNSDTHSLKTIEYVHTPTRNPLRVARSAWRLVRDLGATRDATILEDAFSRSPWLRKYAGWDSVVARLMPGPWPEEELRSLPRMPRLELDKLLATCPPGSLGQVLATHMQRCGLNPNLFRPAQVHTPDDYAIVHITETHDIWHVVTGFGNDEPGEIGLVAFYCSHTGAPIFILLLAVALLNTALFNHQKTAERFDALVEGWNAGKRARSLFGIDWATQWQRPIEEIRRELDLPERVNSGAGILADAA
jgi:ubiquinone biosynthesis protein Coq4